MYTEIFKDQIFFPEGKMKTDVRLIPFYHEKTIEVHAFPNDNPKSVKEFFRYDETEEVFNNWVNSVRNSNPN